MGIKYLGRNIFWLVPVLIILGLISCKNEGTDASGTCIDCVAEKPDKAYLTIKVTLNAENPFVLLTVYHDRFDPLKDTTGYIEFLDTAKTETFKREVPVDHYYSVKATYKSGQNIIYAVDGSILEVQKQSGCDNTCWQVAGGSLDVTLAFKK
jgi:hypothetical protein